VQKVSQEFRQSNHVHGDGKKKLRWHSTLGDIEVIARVRQFNAPEFVHPQWNQSLSDVILKSCGGTFFVINLIFHG